MSTYILTGKYSLDAVKSMSAARTDQANDIVKKFGGEILSMYALLGEKDLLFIIKFPDAQNAMKASVAVTSNRRAISFILRFSFCSSRSMLSLLSLASSKNSFSIPPSFPILLSPMLKS